MLHSIQIQFIGIVQDIMDEVQPAISLYLVLLRFTHHINIKFILQVDKTNKK
jgi:hypothetical protein